MLKSLLNSTIPLKNLPQNVNKITMKASGSKYCIEVHCDNMLPIQIGRYNTKEEAHAAMEQLSKITNREIIK